MLKRFKLVPYIFGVWCSMGLRLMSLEAQEWNVTAEFLYLMPTLDDTYFVLTSSPDVGTPAGTYIAANPSFYPGFRVGGSYGLCSRQRLLQVYYTYLQLKHVQTVTGSDISASFPAPANLLNVWSGYAGSASANQTMLYEKVDALYRQHLGCLAQLAVEWFGGLEYAYVRSNETEVYAITNGNTATVQYKRRTNGIGPQIGVQGEYALTQFFCKCPGRLSLVASLAGSLLVDKMDASLYGVTTISTNPIIANVVYERYWRLVPVSHLRFGLDYNVCVCSLMTSLSVGYEWSTYRKLLPNNFFWKPQAAAFVNYSSFDLQGLYVTANVYF